MKKIAIVTNSCWYILNYGKSLIQAVKKEYEVVLMAPEDEYSKQVEDLAPICFIKNLNRKGRNALQDILLIRELTQNYKQNEIDAVLHFTIKPNIYGSFAAKHLGIPSIAVITGLGYTFLNKGFTNLLVRQLYKRAFNKIDFVLFQNPNDRQLFLQAGYVKNDQSSVIFSSGIDLNVFYPLSKTNNQKGFHFLYLGRLLKDKGVLELLQAFVQSFSNETNTILHIAGNFDKGNPASISEEEFQAVLDKNKNIIYHNKVYPPNQLIANCDCVVLPSYREGFSMSLLEAMAMEKPVIATKVPGCKEAVIDGKNGFLVEAKNRRDLSLKMVQMRNFPSEKRLEMGKQGRTIAENWYSSAKINQQYMQILHRLLS